MYIRKYFMNAIKITSSFELIEPVTQ
jgi:hypothetical protein